MISAGEEDIKDYDRLKALLFKEFQLTAIDCLKVFKKAQRLEEESFVQFPSQTTAFFYHYCNLRSVKDFFFLKKLTIFDKLYKILDAKTKSHTGIKQGKRWFKPHDLKQECDLFYSTSEKCLAEV